MSAIAAILAAMGHDVSGSDVVGRQSCRASERLRVRVGVVVGHVRPLPRSLGDVDAVGRTRPPSRRRRPRRPGGRRPGRRRAHAGGDPRRHLRHPSRRSPSRARTARPRRRRCWPACWPRPGCGPSFIVGGELRESATGAVWDGGEWFVVEADESDGTFVELGAEIAVVTNVEADHLDHYGSLRAHRGGVRSVPRRSTRAEPGVRRRAECRPARRRTRRPHLRHGRRRRLPHRGSGAVDRAGVRVRRRPDGESARATSSCPFRACTTPATPPRPSRLACSDRRARRRSLRALARYAGVARRFELRGAATASRSSTTTPTIRARWRPCWPRRLEPAAGTAIVARVPTAPLHAHGSAVAATSPTRSSTPTWSS